MEQDGLVPVDCSGYISNKVIMFAWMNRCIGSFHQGKEKQFIGHAREKKFGLRGNHRGTINI